MPPTKQGLGRPRDSRIDDAIVRATRELLAEHGYAGLTVDAVATRASIGKAAIYRRYATKQEMIFAAAVHGMQEEPPADTGSLRADLAAVAETFAAQLNRAPADVLTGLLADIYADSALGDRFTETFLVHERLVVVEVLDRAVAREELARPADPLTVQAMLLGPIFAWLLILSGDPDRLPALTSTVAEAVATMLLSDGPIRESSSHPRRTPPATPPLSAPPRHEPTQEGE